MLAIPVLFPMVAAVLSYLAGRRNKDRRDNLVILFCLLELALTALLLVLAIAGRTYSTVIPGFCGFGLSFRLDGFRAMYALIGGVMWSMTSMLSKEYFSRHYHNRNRYYFFFLFTLGATVGVFLSADLYTTFIFFEIMSFTSYTWVAHDETTLAMRSAETYLAVAIIGGMVMLFGLFLLKLNTGTLVISELYEAAKAANARSLYVSGICILIGFGAKAGMFPMHIWLPKAHPVAPAPASALLSGILTKTGIYGVLVLCCELFRGDMVFSNLVLTLGVITMFGGALLGVFSVNLKRTLACSSMSQIGFILVGIACSSILGEHNALAARGTVLYMLNHSLFKLILFMSAGVVYMNLHKLNLNDVRGFGRRRPLLHFAFLMGMFGLMGIPFFSGYVSKTLVHEGIVEMAEHMGEIGFHGLAMMDTVIEWIFLISGGLTGAYMLKLYICIFWEKHPEYQVAYDEIPFYMNGLSRLALFLSAILVPILGIRPTLTMDPIADLMAGVTHQGHFHGVDYFSLTNLKGAAISITIGIVVYLAVIRPLLIRKENGKSIYIDAWPKGLDMEDRLYRPGIEAMLTFGGSIARIADPAFLETKLYAPLIHFLTRAGGTLAAIGSAEILEERVYAPLIRGITFIGFALSKVVSRITDAIAVILTRTIFRSHIEKSAEPHVGNSLVYATGHAADTAMEGLNRTIFRSHPKDHHAVGRLAGRWQVMKEGRQTLTHTMSYALLMFGIGLVATLIYLIFIKG